MLALSRSAAERAAAAVPTVARGARCFLLARPLAIAAAATSRRATPRIAAVPSLAPLQRSFATWPRQSRAPAQSTAPGTAWSPELGLFGCPVRQPADFERLEEEARIKCNGYIEEISKLAPGERLLSLTDALSNELCAVIDLAELVKNVHPDAKFRDAAASASARLAGFMNALNHSPELYAGVSGVAKLAETANWPEEPRRAAMLLQRDMDMQGIGTGAGNKTLITDALDKVHEHSFAFSNAHFAEESQALKLHVDPSEWETFPKEWRPHMLWRGGDVGIQMGAAGHLLRSCASESVRKQVWEQYHSTEAATDQKIALEQIVAARQSLARTLGAASFADHTVGLCVASDAQHVRRLLTKVLEGLQPATHPKSAQEVLALKTAKYCIQQESAGLPVPSNPSALTPEQRAGVDRMVLQPWDEAFLMSRVKLKLFDPATAHSISHYFSVRNVVQGWRLLCKQLFDIELREVDLLPGEAWVEGDEISKLELWETPKSKDGAPTKPKQVGVIYLDLYSRPGKYSHAASFNVRSGCQLMDGSRQMPVVGIVCALTRPSRYARVHAAQRPAGSGSRQHELTLLSHSEVEMLFHEFGHCLHNILSRTQFQHVAGARGELDFVEMPSTLFEHFAGAHEFVRQWATHFQTNEPIPAPLLGSIMHAKHAFSNLDLIHQALLSLFDQHVYGSELQAPAGSSKPLAEIGRDMGAAYHALHVKYSPFHPASTPSGHPYLRVLHLTTYAASYYCYLYCRVFSSLLWQRSFDAAPMQRQMGTKLREQLFAPGGGKDAKRILAELVDLDPKGAVTLQAFVEAQLPVFIRAVATEGEQKAPTKAA